jgi:hypothetical protein
MLIRSTSPYHTDVLFDTIVWEGVPQRVLEAGNEPQLMHRLSAAGAQTIRGHDVEMDLTHLPFADRTFDVVVAKGILEQFPQAMATVFLSELARVTKMRLLLWFHRGLRQDGCLVSYCAPNGEREWEYPEVWVRTLLDRWGFFWQSYRFAVTSDTFGVAVRGLAHSEE